MAQNARIVSVVAATLISLACGTNYVFSAWGPQFAQRMHFTQTETNLIATFGNLGVYAVGIPVGIMTDNKGPKPGVLGGSVLVGLGYLVLHKAYDWGPDSVALPLLCIASFATGLGSCAAFAGSIKTSALNWPRHQGTATSFPLAAYGLSAFLFAFVARVFAPNDASELLLVLSVGGFSLIFISSFFLRVIAPQAQYRRVPGGSDPNKLHRIESNGSRKALLGTGGEFLRSLEGAASSSRPRSSGHRAEREDGDRDSSFDHDSDLEDDNETTAAIRDDPEGVAGAGSSGEEDAEPLSAESAHKSVYADVRGVQMLKYIEFYQYFLLLGLLTGTGLMTINNIGNDAQALWTKYDRNMPLEAIRQRQSVHVSIISICSFLGRLASGIGSDIVVKQMERSRVWCLFGSASAFTIAQIMGLTIEDPQHLYMLSALTGLAYGFLFGCFPSAVAETFGVSGLSTNWGVLTLAPVLFANIFNLMYGAIFDKHSYATPGDDGRPHHACIDGRFCYHGAYWGTLVASFAAMLISLWSIWHLNRVKARIGWKGEGGEHMS